MLIFFGLALTITVFAIAFALQNSATITVALLTMQVQASLALVLFTTFALGALGALLACAPSMIRGKLEVVDLQRKLRQLETPPAGKAPTASPENPEPTA